MIADPILHAGVVDALPEDHPWAYETLFCDRCATMVHAFNNETMTEWIEDSTGVWCLKCAALDDAPELRGYGWRDERYLLAAHRIELQRARSEHRAT